VATMDRAVGTANATGGTGNLGGALASPGVVAAAMAQNNNVWIRSGTYTCSPTANVAGGRVDVVTGAQFGAASRWVGYQSVRGDYGTPPVLMAGAANVTIFAVDASNVVLENVALSNTAGSFGNVTGLAVNSSHAGAYRVAAAGCTATHFNVGNLAVLADCVADGPGTGFTFGSAGTTLLRCTATNGVNTPGFGGGNFNSLVGCTAANRSGTNGHGFTNGSGYFVSYTNCTATGCASGFELTSLVHARLANCLSYGNRGTGFAIWTDSALFNCAAGANASAIVNAPAVNLGFITLTANPFTNAAGLDFSPNRAAGGGASLRAAGVPSVLPGTNTPSYPDVGAAQHRDPGPIVAPLQPGTYHFLG
jgi:hypothetical protein